MKPGNRDTEHLVLVLQTPAYNPHVRPESPANWWWEKKILCLCYQGFPRCTYTCVCPSERALFTVGSTFSPKTCHILLNRDTCCFLYEQLMNWFIDFSKYYIYVFSVTSVDHSLYICANIYSSNIREHCKNCLLFQYIQKYNTI